MIVVLRLGHRIPRDARVSTHVALVARAFGADKMIYTGTRDKGLEESVDKVRKMWGGDFLVEYAPSWEKIVREFKGVKVHLTMYGVALKSVLDRIKGKDLLVIVGGKKVPSEIFEVADFNVSITNQPHSEIGALAVCLHECVGGRYPKFEGGRKIIPSAKEKIII